MSEKLKALAEKWRDAAYDLQRFGQSGGLYLVCANELLASLDSAEVPTKPEVCRWDQQGGHYYPSCRIGAPWSIRRIYGVGFKYCPDCGRKIKMEGAALDRARKGGE